VRERLDAPSPAARCPGPLFRAYSALAAPLRANHTLHRMLFGYRPPQGFQGQLWDWTTVLLRCALRRHARPGMSVLDMGTGPVGVLAICAKRICGGEVCGVDHIGELLVTARESAARCRAEIEFHQSSLFSAVRRRYDLVLFNAPYLESATGLRLGVLRSSLDQTRWSGGESGLETMERFLEEVPRHLTVRGVALLGVNHFHVPPARCEQAFRRAHLEVLDTVRSRLVRACVYRLRPAGAG